MHHFEYEKKKNLTIPNAPRRPSSKNFHLGMQQVRSPWKTPLRSVIKLNIVLPYDPATVILGIYPTDLKIYIHTGT